jgi:AcrR family transcriptional regulator
MSTPMANPTRQKRMPRQEREQRMLDAAEEVFSAHSFVAAPMEEIAQRSGITKAMLYQYFGSKEGLYEATIERGRTRLFDDIVASLEGVTVGPAQLEAFVRGYFAYVEENRGTWWLLYGETGSAAVNEMRSRNSELIEGLLREAVDDGSGTVEPRVLTVLARTLVGAGEEVGRWWAAHPEIPREQVVEDFLAIAAGAIAGVVRAAAHA